MSPWSKTIGYKLPFRLNLAVTCAISALLSGVASVNMLAGTAVNVNYGNVLD